MSLALGLIPAFLRQQDRVDEVPPARPATPPLQRLGLPVRPIPDAHIVATVRLVSDGGRRGNESPLVLRQRVLDAIEQIEGVVFLATRDGSMTHIRDSEDGTVDRSVDLTRQLSGQLKPLPPSHPHHVAPINRYEIVVEDSLAFDGEILIPPKVVSVDADSAQVSADGAVRLDRELGSYRVQSQPLRYDDPSLRRGSFALESVDRFVPKAFDERDALQRKVHELLPDRDNDLITVRRLTDAIRQSGTLDAPALWDGRYVPLLDGEVAGDCIHYAQLLAIMARLAGIPARVALGYRTAEWSEERQCFLVRDTHFWAWTEIQFERLGWLRFDPTPQWQQEASPAETTTESESNELATTTDKQSYGEQLDAEFSALVMEEDASQSGSLWEILGLVAIAGVTLTLAVFHLQRESRRETAAPQLLPVTKPAKQAWRYWQRFLDVCTAQGVQKIDSWTATEFVRKVAPLVPAQAQGIRILAQTYYDCRFGGAALDRDRQRLIDQCLQQLPEALATAVRQARGERSPRKH